MIAIQGIYDNGRIQLSEAAPMKKAKVIVIFPDNEDVEKEQMTKDDAKKILNKFTASINRDIDERTK